ncbi:hypothetical protein CWATWH8502_1670 [Crocosphaera watsonii WH 8502]|uniref:Uncharacterized protein n=1 Tax=Crocosphaera watsonii WH 8502 TaxID=423474 RepID=T2IDT2_CROWT|nr:hypothetical protein CWATWH8502_1670 [Crocosphaera watsonii WH 8502]
MAIADFVRNSGEAKINPPYPFLTPPERRRQKLKTVNYLSYIIYRDNRV